jgi:hypothetical protein
VPAWSGTLNHLGSWLRGGLCVVARHSQCLFYRESSPESLRESRFTQPDSARPFSYAESFTLMSQQNRAFLRDGPCWRSKDLFDGPTLMNPPEHHGAAQAQFVCPFSSGQGFSSKRQEDTVAPIPCLLLWQRPFAILRSVMPINILAVERMVRRWAHAHIHEKVGERMSPTITNHDPSTAIVRILASLGTIAAIYHASPCLIFGSAHSTIVSHF